MGELVLCLIEKCVLSCSIALGIAVVYMAGAFGLSLREVAEMLAEGYTYTYIRAALGVSDGTVKSHVAHVYQKLGIHRKDELLELIDRRMG